VSGPTGIAAGPDGNMWFTERETNRIGRITTGRGLEPVPALSLSMWIVLALGLAGTAVYWIVRQ
jgi:hypothetical protein